jgi:hypothetical protein
MEDERRCTWKSLLFSRFSAFRWIGFALILELGRSLLKCLRFLMMFRPRNAMGNIVGRSLVKLLLFWSKTKASVAMVRWRKSCGLETLLHHQLVFFTSMCITIAVM